MSTRSTEPVIARHTRTVMPILLERVLGRDTFDGASAAEAIADEIDTLGGDAIVERWGEGWKVSSTIDWLPLEDPLDVFDRARPLRDELPHSCFAEVLLVPHCAFVAAGTPHGVTVLQHSPGMRFTDRAAEGRVVWFVPG